MLEAETYLPKGWSHIETEINLYSGRCWILFIGVLYKLFISSSKPFVKKVKCKLSKWPSFDKITNPQMISDNIQILLTTNKDQYFDPNLHMQRKLNLGILRQYKNLDVIY